MKNLIDIVKTENEIICLEHLLYQEIDNKRLSTYDINYSCLESLSIIKNELDYLDCLGIIRLIDFEILEPHKDNICVLYEIDIDRNTISLNREALSKLSNINETEIKSLIYLRSFLGEKIEKINLKRKNRKNKLENFVKNSPVYKDFTTSKKNYNKGN